MLSSSSGLQDVATAMSDQMSIDVAVSSSLRYMDEDCGKYAEAVHN